MQNLLDATFFKHVFPLRQMLPIRDPIHQFDYPIFEKININRALQYLKRFRHSLAFELTKELQEFK